jgi:hypothetical protein
MSEKPQPDRAPDEETPPHPAEPLQIDTPVIDIQGLEHKPGPDTRVSNQGIRITPHLDSTDDRDFAKEDRGAIDAMQAFEKTLREQLSG